MVVCALLFCCASLLSSMYDRTVGIFNQAIFRSPLVGSYRRTAEEEGRQDRTRTFLRAILVRDLLQ